MLFSRTKKTFNLETAANSGSGRLAIIAGSGPMPGHIARSAERAGEAPFIFAIRGETDMDLAGFDHAVVAVSQISTAHAIATEKGIGRVACAGNFRRPDFDAIKWEWGALKAVPKLLQVRIGGDDRANTIIADVIEAFGFRLVGPLEIAPDIAAPEGVLTKKKPDRNARADMECGLAAIRLMGPLDIGQAVVAASGRIVAVEAAEGTDAMVERCAGLRSNGRFRVRPPSGVLVKAAKPSQDRRLDLPVAGIRTVEMAIEAQLAGIAIEAGSVLVPEREEMVRLADKAGMFIVGMSGDA
ncbi:MAG: UDP-2,3-diacylglucosamine diphosphatase LpxI [Rhodobiaceae bacterium]|nr:UDP-2,3-diacylglucosamine diphosphatase LpxI [Rhodobiaceae bacterium]MCC0057505.1 UDP-2,3-diacylglucosamine diphosphatase LpxI [Rhodobiaceae bacterium]